MKLEQKIQAVLDIYLILFGYYHYVENFLWCISFKVRVTVTALLVRVTPCLMTELICSGIGHLTIGRKRLLADLDMDNNDDVLTEDTGLLHVLSLTVHLSYFLNFIGGPLIHA